MSDNPTSPTAHRPPSAAVVAHFVMVGLYLLAIAAALLLVAAPFVEWMVLGRLDVEVLVAVVAGIVAFRVLVPDPVRFDPSGPEVERAEQPELFEILDMVASATRQPMPRAVHLLDEMNAYLAEVGGFLGIGSRRVLGIGMPLMTVLDTEEFGAVIAHEFGHLHREAGRIGALVYMTRQAVVRQVLDAPPSLLRKPLMAYARAYLRATAPIARNQELGADQLAARATSRRAVAAALARLPWSTVAYETYHRTEYLPLVMSGHRPALLDGFETFLTSSLARDHLPAATSAALGSSTGSSLDCHPPVAERLAALGATQADIDERPLPEVRSTALVRDVDRLEARLAARRVGDVVFEPIAWDDVGRDVLVPRWRAERRELVGELPEGFHLGALPIDRAGLAELGGDIAQRTGEALDSEDLVAQGHRAARAIIGEHAAGHGLEVEMVPGEPVWFGRAPEQFGLFAAYDAVVEGVDGPALWFDLLEESGLAPTTGTGSTPTPAPAPAPAPAPPPPAPAPVPPPPAAAPSVPDRASARAPGDAIDAHRRKVFAIPAAMGRHHELVIEGDTLTYRADVVAADEVTHVAYWSGDDAEVRLWVGERQVRIRLDGGQKNKDVVAQAWEAAVAWIDGAVAPRLVQRALARLAERGRVQVGDQTIAASGVVVRGRVVPWAVLTGASLDGREIQIRQRADGRPRGEVVARLDASEPNMVLVPPLMVAASAAAAGAATSPLP